MSYQYNPTRQKAPVSTGDPLEVELVFNVRACGTCDFFWPDNPAEQSYGPYPLYDFTSNYPDENSPEGTPESYPWMNVVTRDSGFPNGEVIDGCRKAPIMTIGINPNMTAFSPGRTGTSWCYPGFADNGGDGFTKYAYYYRYRNVYQERFDFDKICDYLLDGSEYTITESCTVVADQIKADKDGYILKAERPDAGPTFDIAIKYDGAEDEITITLDRDKGDPRYVLLFDHEEPNNAFKAGDVIVAKLDVPSGESLECYQQLQTYYEQFVPSLNLFNQYLIDQGHSDSALKIGEDVCQLDMVACASPHWNPNFLGGTKESEQTIINNCVSTNSWAMKQLVQTQPAILFLVGESSYSMFRESFGNLIKRDPPLPTHPYDFAFTLFRETTDSSHPTYFEYTTMIDGRDYTIKTRLIVTPHFSYDDNFKPQFRLSANWLKELETKCPDCIKFLKTDPRITFVESNGYGYDAFMFDEENEQAILNTIQQKYPDCWKELQYDYYHAHQTMAEVMEQLYSDGTLAYNDASTDGKGYLVRSEGSCHFCINKHWSFPDGCCYGKTEQTPPPADFLKKVAAEIVANGKPQKA